jgi:serine/threonine-protein kinase RsbW
VRFHLARAPLAPVEIRLTDRKDEFSVQVVDSVQRIAPDVGGELAFHLGAELATDLGGGEAGDTGASVDLEGHERIGLAVISGLVDDVAVEYLDSGSTVTMTWPIG